jgi:Mce-associated membrane protein
MSKTVLDAETEHDDDLVEPKSKKADDKDVNTEDGKRLSVSVRSLVYSAVIVVLAVAVGVLTWLYVGAMGQLGAQSAAAANEQRAKDVALNYAVNAAQMNFKDFGAWKVKLVDNTTPELKDKLDRAATDMEQVLAPLQWDSTARPLAAAVRSDAAGIYVVDTFVSVLTKTMQAPEGMQSTATYGITIDSNNGWQISDVGGIDAVLGQN